MKINRRKLVLGSGLAIAGVYASQSLFNFVQQPIAHTHTMEEWDGYLTQDVDAFSSDTRNLVNAMSETLLPRTDTPGAIDVGVPKFIELLYANWMKADEREIFDEGFAEINLRAQNKYQQTFVKLNPTRQRKILEAIEDATPHAWYELGGASIVDTQTTAPPPFFVMFKEIAVTGFFMSEIGSTEILRNNLGGEFIADLPLSRNDSSWAATPLV